MNNLLKWQLLLLPLMIVILMGTMLFFFYQSTQQINRVQNFFNETDTISIASGLPLNFISQDSTVNKEYADLIMRARIEQQAMSSRHRQGHLVLITRIWTLYTTFLTGFILAIVGCAFVLGKMNESLDAGGGPKDANWWIKTNSPGLVLAILGTVLIIVALQQKAKIEIDDKPLYLPVTVKIDQNEETKIPGLNLEGKIPNDIIPDTNKKNRFQNKATDDIEKEVLKELNQQP